MTIRKAYIVGVLALLATPANAQMLGNAPPAPSLEKAATGPDVAARTEIIYRANLGRADDIKLLVDQGGSPNQATGEGVPLLSLAASRRDPEGKNVVEMLVKLGANINGRDRKGQTALFYAAKAGNVEIVNLLLADKIDAFALDNNGDTARTVAFASGHNDVVQAMDNFAAKPKPAPAPAAEQTPAPLDEHQKELENQLAEMKKNAPTVEDMKRIENEITEANRNSMAPAAPPANTTVVIPEENEQKKEADVEQISHDIAFNTCGFQYWSYCSQVKQGTELESEELSVAIQSYKAKVETLKKSYLQSYGKTPADYANIVDSSQQRIYNQLNGMHSNQERHEHNIGKMDDMLERCGEIGRQWAVDPPGIDKPKKDSDDNNKGVKGGKINNSNGGNGKLINPAPPQPIADKPAANKPIYQHPPTSNGGNNVAATPTPSNSAGTSAQNREPGQPPLQVVPSYPEFK